MKNTLFQKLTALILALAMTLSLAGTAFAEELTQYSAESSAAEESALPVEGEADTESVEGTDEPQESGEPEADSASSGTETSAGDASAAENDPADDPAAETDPADASSSADSSASSSAEEVLDPQDEIVLGWVIVSDNEETVSTSSEGSGEETADVTDETAAAVSDESEETVTTASEEDSETGTHYEFIYKDENGNVNHLDAGYYYLPAMTVTDTTDTTMQTTATSKAGIYYFDADGKLAVEENSDTLLSTKANKKTTAYVLSSADFAGSDYKTSYKSYNADDYTLTDCQSILAISDAYTEAYTAAYKAAYGEDDTEVQRTVLDFEVDPTVAAPYVKHTGRVSNGVNLWCVDGELYSGFWRCMANTDANNDAGYDTRLYYIVDGAAALYKGKMNAASAALLGITAQYAVNGTVKTTLDGKVYNNGVVYTGLFTSAYAGNPDYGYYSKGVLKDSVNGWWYYNKNTKKWSQKPFKTKINKKKQVYGVINQVYYFKNGYVYRNKNNVKLSSMDGSGTKYYYTFKSNGQLVTNLFKYNSSYKKKKLKIIVSRKNHTCTIFAYNSKTKKYDIPCKSFVVATAKKSSNFKPGTYKLGSQKMWMNDQQATGNPLNKCSWYRYATHISGSGALFHSSNYWPKGNTHGSISQMKGHIYNQLGTNVTAACVRCQIVNCKLIYNLKKVNSSIKVQLGYSSTNDAFGTMTLEYNFDQTGGTVTKGSGKSKDSTTDPTEKMAIW